MKRFGLVGLALLGLVLISCNVQKENNKSETDSHQIQTTQQSSVSIKLTDVNFDKIVKIGIVSVHSNKATKKYEEKEEKIIDDSKVIKKFIDILKKSNVNENLFLDRLPGEYKINIYFGDKTSKTAYFWIQQKEYNFDIEGVVGEITVNSEEMDNLIMGAVGEVGRERIFDPYN